MNNEYLISGLTLEFKDEYEDFPTFVEKTTDPIYRAMLNAFNDVIKIGKTRLTIKAYVDDIDFDSVFVYTKDDAYVLKDIINPYFEEKEDYETCAKVMEIYSKLTNS